MAKAAVDARGRLNIDATLGQVDIIIRGARIGFMTDELISNLRELLEDAMTLSNSEGYDDGLNDGRLEAGEATGGTADSDR